MDTLKDCGKVSRDRKTLKRNSLEEGLEEGAVGQSENNWADSKGAQRAANYMDCKCVNGMGQFREGISEQR